ncbi:MAG: M3 family oligoendopeptidase [Candidatus Pacebacteria bacterium]|nr:M3 family oligoendopeptidase [Candidatus Paceibacterota bacterium]MBP9852075.1 M3 family oligoendopeptidase [Candidatus Paceibacterota bacterium]
MKHKTEWNLGLMYSSPKDPKIEKDVVAIEKAIAAFAKKYSKNDKYLKDAGFLKKALDDYESLDDTPNPMPYFYLFLDINSGHKDAEAGKNRISQRLTAAGNQLIFFRIALGKIPKDMQKKFLADPRLAKYRYFLEQIFASSKYVLTEAEEKIMSLKNLSSRELWVSGQESLLSKQTVTIKGKVMPLSEAALKAKDLPTKERHAAYDIITKHLRSISDFAESEMNAIVIDKKVSDELRGYSKPYSATILGYQNTEKEIESLVKTVSEHFPIAHRYHKIKAEMLGLKKLEYSDRAASVGETKKKITYAEAIDIVGRSFRKANPKYEAILHSYLEQGQIDAFPRKGKKSGAYCWSNVNLPTYVLLNHIENLDSVSTLAHEMGHAIHGEFSKTQSPIYQGHTISVAEVASTLFENFAFDEVLETLTEKEKIIALHDKIGDDVMTIFRQIALFNFEVELHQTIREKGSMSKEDIAALMNKHMKSYLGPVFEMKENDGYTFITWSHIRRFFYVYSYAYGQIISKALYKKYKEDPSYLKKIEEFLAAGESKSPEKIFKDIGIDTSDPAFFKAGLESIKEDIIRLEKLVRGAKSKKK